MSIEIGDTVVFCDEDCLEFDGVIFEVVGFISGGYRLRYAGTNPRILLAFADQVTPIAAYQAERLARD